MNITEYKKKNGTIVYRASVYLGVDKLTGKKHVLLSQPALKKGLKLRLEKPSMLLPIMGIVPKKNKLLRLIEN